MSRRNDLLVGQIALEGNLATREQLREALRDQDQRTPRRTIGVILVARGYPTDR